MEEPVNKERREELFSRAVRAGKRTYFFDVKATRAEEHYLTITESKRRFNNEQGKFFYEKHKIFLYKEDFDKFKNGLTDVLDFIQTGVAPVEKVVEEETSPDKPAQVEFEDLTSGAEKEEVESTEKIDD
ncbi:MAG: PUR family DNA/RNA-binding protein [Bacteroidetes bacterium]|nr:PUR family DNA/RNA-binding protein [Bacteroidota bacterium]